MISYKPFWDTIKKKKITSYALTEKLGVPNATLTRMRRNGYISTRTLDDLCSILNCKVQDIILFIPSEKK